ncbi:MAG: TVP38/TMEM64 family protein [Verrucomicrobiales bacterium]|nr:TVP38/TMEM64 family protein [Verrucomicrobiales bacterium]
MSDSRESSSRSFPWKLIGVGGVILALILSNQFLPVDQWLKALLDWIDGLGFWGPVIFILVYIALTVLMIPGSILTMGSGLLFGLGWGTLWTVVASNIGASLAFLIGRHFARDKVEKRIEGNEKFEAIDEAVSGEGWKIVVLTRLSPVFPFNLLNYAYGLTNVKWRSYAVASLVGMFPGTLLYVYLGAIGRLAGEASERKPGEIAMLIVGIAATFAVTFFITKSARKALSDKTGIGKEGSNE